MKHINKLFIGAVVLYFFLVVPTTGFPALEDFATIGIYFFFLVLSLAIIISSVFIHELGHFFFGKWTGYRFENFKAWTFVAYKDSAGKIQTDSDMNDNNEGQCLMRPPVKEDFKLFLYVAGGVIFNTVMALFFLFLFYLLKDLNVNAPTFSEYLVRSLMRLSVITGFVLNLYMIVINWIPLRGMINDGYVWRKSRKNPKTKDAIYDYLLLNSDLNRGASLKRYNIEPVEANASEFEDLVQLAVGNYVFEHYLLKGHFDKAYAYMKKYREAAYRLYKNNIPEKLYLDMYLISLLYFEGQIIIPFQEEHEKILEKHEETLRYAFLRLVKDYYDRDETLNESMYEAFLIVCRKHHQETVVAEYLSLFQKIVATERQYVISEVDLSTVWQIRHEVMWPQESLDFVKLEDDMMGVHLGLSVDGTVVSVISLFQEDDEVQFRKFATKEAYQKKGYGSKLLHYTLMLLEDKKIDRIHCNARAEKSSYYQKYGLKETEVRFTKNHQDYIVMELKNHHRKK